MVPLKPLSEKDFKILNSCIKNNALPYSFNYGISSSIIHNKQLSYLERENEIVISHLHLIPYKKGGKTEFSAHIFFNNRRARIFKGLNAFLSNLMLAF